MPFTLFLKFQVNSWLLLSFAFAFYIQFSEENTNQEVCRTKFRNCTEIITTLDTTELKTEILDGCVDFFNNCTQTNPDKNLFNGWIRTVSKTLAMSAGELTFDELSLDDNPIYFLSVVLFTIMVLFVIMNLMTSLAVSDVAEIRKQKNCEGWIKVMYSLEWYDAALPCIFLKKKRNADKNIINISFLINHDPFAKGLYNFFMHPPSVSVPNVNDENQLGNTPQEKIISIVHNMDNFEDIIIIFGTTKKYYEVILKKGQKYIRPPSFWKTKFAIVYGYEIEKEMYHALRFTASEGMQLEIKFIASNGEFVVFDQASPDNCLNGTKTQYVDAKPTKEVLDAIERYNIE